MFVGVIDFRSICLVENDVTNRKMIDTVSLCMTFSNLIRSQSTITAPVLMYQPISRELGVPLNDIGATIMIKPKLSFLLCILVLARRTELSFAFSHFSVTSPLQLARIGRAAKEPSLRGARTRCHQLRRDEDAVDMASLEREVRASAKVRMDMDRVNRVLTEVDGDPKKTVLHSDDWKVALAAAIAAAAAVDIVTKSLFLAGVSSIGVFFIANQNPINEGDGIEGPLARAVGRQTLELVESSKPKLKAVARAVITDEEDIEQLRQKVMELHKENVELKLWKQRRIAVDEALSSFTLPQLSGLARQNRLRTGGTKAEVLMRLVEAGVIEL